MDKPSLFISSAAWVLMTITSGAACAQTVVVQHPPAAKDDSVSEVIVTAQKRSERLQEVAGSVAAVTGLELKAMSATGYGDYLNSVPGVAFTDSGGYKDKVFIRGLGDSLSSRVLSTTGIYLDETPITEVDSSLADVGTFDINRVEILRGPQGTLYGSESMGGTVRIITNKPVLNALSADIDIVGSGTQHGGGNYQFNGMVNIPLITDKLALRVVGEQEHDSGYIDNVLAGQKGINDNNITTSRVELAGKPFSRYDFLFTFNYQKATENSGPFEDIALQPYQVSRSIPETNRFDTKIYSLEQNFHLDFATLTSITSYIDKENFTIRDLTPELGGAFSYFYGTSSGITPPNSTGVGLSYQFPNDAFTQEFRLTSTSSGPLHWIAGLYYNDFAPTTMQMGLNTFAPAKNFNLYTVQDMLDRKELAEFIDVSYDVTSKFQLTAGVRNANYFFKDNGSSSGALNGGVASSAQDKAQESAVSPRFRADYKISNDNLIYALASEGFRPGGVNGDQPTSCLASLQELGYTSTSQVYSYNSDSVWNYELGSKNEFANHKIQINGDVYYIDWKNTQVAQNLACGEQILSNAGGAESKGAELEVQYHPLPGLALGLGGAYTDATYDTTNASIQTTKGGSLPNIPKWTFNGSVRYSHETPWGFDAYVYADTYYVDIRQSYLPLSHYNTTLPSYAIVNARVGMSKGPYTLAVFVKNLTNKVAIENNVYNTGYDYNVINQPRTIGVELDAKY